MEQNNWVMSIEFDSLEKQAEAFPEMNFPNDSVSRCIRKLIDMWGLLPEEFNEISEWTSTTLKFSFEVLDNIHEFIPWLIMNTIPRKFEVVDSAH